MTIKQLKRIIKEEIQKLNESIEMKDVDFSNLKSAEDKIEAQWPHVTYNGLNIIDLIHKASDKTFKDREGQEVYLGYDPKNDLFYNGFDVLDGRKNGGNAIYKFKVNDNGEISNIKRVAWGSQSGIFYNNSNGGYSKKPSNIVDLRLD